MCILCLKSIHERTLMLAPWFLEQRNWFDLVFAKVRLGHLLSASCATIYIFIVLVRVYLIFFPAVFDQPEKLWVNTESIDWTFYFFLFLICFRSFLQVFDSPMEQIALKPIFIFAWVRRYIFCAIMESFVLDLNILIRFILNFTRLTLFCKTLQF